MAKTKAKSTAKAKKGKERSQVKNAASTAKRTRSSKQNEKLAETDNSAETETAYEWLLRKVNENKRKATDEINKELELAQVKKAKSSKVKDSIPTECFGFQDDDNYIEMEVSKTIQRREFP